MKKSIVVILLLLAAIFSVSIFAEQEYLEAKNYTNLSIQEFLAECKSQNKNAYFNKNTYTLTTDLTVVEGVDMIGEEGAIFQSKDIQRYIYDKSDVKNITIEHIIFDNVSIWCQREGSTGWTIRQNIFLNARDLDVTMGCKPDSNGKNGGPATGYYIQNKRGSMQILSNMFLRNASSLGRGVATYFTTNVIIKDNFFGRLEDVEGSIVSSETKKLKEIAVASGLVDLTQDYGYFMTGINILNTDKNAKIIGNYMSFNTHISEAGYEDGSQSTKGYNRDHFVYAKAFINLEIVGNYFKGMNKNQDGGVKCRNGDGLLLYKNVLEDTLILLYVQDDATGAILKNVDIRENIFINKDYTSKLIKIPYGNNKELSKYLTVDYSVLFLNYKADADVDSITISSNLFYSNGLGNEQIRIDNKDKTFDTPKNIFIANNRNILGTPTRVTTRNFKDQENVDVRTDWNNGVEYQANIAAEYKAIDVAKLAELEEVPYKITDGKLITDAEKAYIDGTLYTNQTLSVGKKYFLFLLKSKTSTILVENSTKEEVPSFQYTAIEIEVKEKGFQVHYQLNGHGSKIASLEDVHTLPTSLPIPQETGWEFGGWYLDASLTTKAEAGIEITADTTLYAKWERKSYQVNFHTNGGSFISPITVDYGTEVSKPAQPTKSGYTFIGWYTDQALTQEFNFSSKIEDHITLYAKWIKVTYKIIFDSLGHGIKPNDIEVENKIPILLPNLEENGWKFEGWFLDATCTTKVVLGSPVEEDIILYAKWTEIFYKVYFADTDIEIVSVKWNGFVTKPSDPSKEGYTFLGWYKDKECLQPWNFTTDTVTKAITLFPKWEKIKTPEPNLFKIQFESNGGDILSDINVLEGSLLAEPKPPIKEGYTFLGWYKDSSLTQAWNFAEDIVSESMTLYAKWIENPPLETPLDTENQTNLATILSVSISIGVGILGLGLIVYLGIRKKRSK